METSDTIQIYKALDNLCKDPIFSGSKQHVKILRYLVEQMIKENNVKEYTIGIELFNLDYSEDKNNGAVRVYIFKLRKRLKEYYNSGNNKDNIIFKIEKGQYNLSYEICKTNIIGKTEKPNNNNANFYKKSNSPKLLSIRYKLVPLLILIFLGIYIITFLSTSNTFCWKDYLKKDSNTICVISNQFVVNKKENNNIKHGTLFPEINSESDFFKYIEKHPQSDLSIPDYTVLSKMAPFAIKNLTEFFSTYSKTFDISFETEFKIKNIKDNNYIFVGQFKTMSTSKNIFLKNSKCFSTFKDGFLFKTDTLSKIYDTQRTQSNNIEYAMVSFIREDNGTSKLFFVSNNDIGVIATVRRFCNIKWLKQFYTSVPKDTKNYNALFEVSGIQRTDLSCKLIHLETF